VRAIDSVEALTANSKREALQNLAKEFGRAIRCNRRTRAPGALKERWAGTGYSNGAGEAKAPFSEGPPRVRRLGDGVAGGVRRLKPALARFDRGAAVALANKDCMVVRRFLHAARGELCVACMPAGGFETTRVFRHSLPAIREGNWCA